MNIGFLSNSFTQSHFVDCLNQIQKLKQENVSEYKTNYQNMILNITEQPQLHSIVFPMKFENLYELYTGPMSKVILLKEKHGNVFQVAKITQLRSDSNSEFLHIINEALFTAQLQTKTVSRLLKTESFNLTKNTCTRMMDFACRGNISELVGEHFSSGLTIIQKMEKLNVIKSILWQTLLGLEQIHSLGFIIRDLKPSNIVIDHQGKLLLCDFGLVGPIGEIDTSICGTPQYMPPQRLNNKRFTNPLSAKVDIWSFGVVAYELIMGDTPYVFQNNNIEGLVESMYSGHLYFDEQLPSESKRLIFSLLNPNPNKRLSIETIKKHQFFAQIEQKPLLYQRCCCPSI